MKKMRINCIQHSFLTLLMILFCFLGVSRAFNAQYVRFINVLYDAKTNYNCDTKVRIYNEPTVKEETVWVQDIHLSLLF